MYMVRLYAWRPQHISFNINIILKTTLIVLTLQMHHKKAPVVQQLDKVPLIQMQIALLMLQRLAVIY